MSGGPRVQVFPVAVLAAVRGQHRIRPEPGQHRDAESTRSADRADPQLRHRDRRTSRCRPTARRRSTCLCGVNSMLALKYAAYRKMDPFGEVWLGPLADAGGGHGGDREHQLHRPGRPRPARWRFI